MEDLQAYFAKALRAQVGFVPAAPAAGLWRPADQAEAEKFERDWCRHCIHDKAEDWEDEFGNHVPGCCVILDCGMTGNSVEEWVTRDGLAACLAFEQDARFPARCLKTMEMF
ncbi:hypothetical protein DEM27_31750 [Metarhizobium album]|uniref:Uncharacterized protein n=1 Tax=Metarhizobium album TaxID=2182425 RepID=A0A2U2DG68_9HYPH|nr:hypothetical protein [Rhizobium album]PWE52316.1 hypothetical protein DEM27_31750 [Rhizobium album]